MRVFMGKPEENRLKVSQYVVQEDNLNPPTDLNLSMEKAAGTCTVTHTVKIMDKIFDGYQSEGKCKYVINLQPFYIQCYYNEQLAMIVNHRQLFNYERYRERDPLLAKASDVTDLIAPLTYWEQKALMHRVPAPRGPSSVALDFTFVELGDCYGLAARTRTSLLQQTIAKSPIATGTTTTPYRLYNIDNYEDKYINQSLYGNIPLIVANNYSKPYNAALLWLNASDTYVDLDKKMPENHSLIHVISECGVLEFFTFIGGSPYDISTAYGKVTGIAQMPQRFLLGYHQCRWDKDTEKDFLFFSDKFEEIKMPCDCFWLDIEHTDDKKYFTWDKSIFPTPMEMLAKLHKKGRKIVVIVDPHLKVDPDYYVYKGAIDQSTAFYFQPSKPP